jgi:hypothetical protein
MADDLRERVLAAVRKGLAGPLDSPKRKNRGYTVTTLTLLKKTVLQPRQPVTRVFQIKSRT